MGQFLIYIDRELNNRERILWLFKTAILALNLKDVAISEDSNAGSAGLIINENNVQTDLARIETFELLELVKNGKFSEKGILINQYGEDFLLTAFYLINSLQEYNSKQVDNIGRFKYDDSYQKKYDLIKINHVTVLFESYFKKYFPDLLQHRVFEKSSFFFSHDIDSLYGAFLQDGLAALKKGRFDVISRVIINTAILKPDWFNIDKILKIESEHDIRSTFFWIVNKGRVNKKLTNADYDIQSPKLKKTIQQVLDKGNSIGLHKSISDQTFNDEIKKLGHPVIANRNHYLRLQLPAHYDQIQNSDIKVDCSLGFAEHYGFRNSLAIPFVPFNIKENKAYDFLEVSLNLMDGTFQKYMNVTPEKTSLEMIDFIEKNKTNSVLSVLWHNHFFSSFRFNGYLKPYVDLLVYLKEKQYHCTDPQQLISKYKI